MTPCIGPYSPVAAIWRKSVENASIRPTLWLALIRSANSAVVQVGDCRFLSRDSRI